MKRDLRLDTLRGLVMVWMTINHIGGPLHAYSFQTLGFISSAEGFVFVSGVVAGMVYGRIGLTQGSNLLRKRSFRRALDIYGYQMVAFIVVLVMELGITNMHYQSYYKLMNPLPMESPLTALGLGAVFLWQPAFLDILPMYCLYLLITPFAITLFIKKHGHWWVLGASFLIWSFATYPSWDSLQRFGERFLPCNLGFFNPFAWQFLFIGGLFCGFRRTAAREIPVRKSLLIVSSLVVIGLLLFRYKFLSFNLFGFNVESLTIRESFGPLRVINLAALAYLITCLGIQFPKMLEWKLFSFIGQHSLQVFTFHIVLLYSILPLRNLRIPFSLPLIILATIAIVSTLTLPAWVHAKYQEGKQGRRPL